MSMKNLLCLCAASALAVVAYGEGMWTGLSDEAHVMGPKIGETDLLGKVVLVDTTFDGRIEQIWSSFKTKKFMTVGSVRESIQGLKAKSYPVYKRFGLAVGDPNTRMFVVNHRGRVVYAGSSDRDATEAVVNALGQVGMPLSLTGGASLRKFKSMEKKLVLGKAIKSDVKALENAVKKGDGKIATKVQKADAAEARQILKAIAEGREDAKREIDVLMRANPEEAVKAIKAFTVTFPEEGAAYKDRIPELTERVKELKAAQKAARK